MSKVNFFCLSYGTHERMPASTGRLDAELVSVSKRVSNVLMNLPRDITPVNLEELRRVKQCLVELESKADNLRYSLLTATLMVVRWLAHVLSLAQLKASWETSSDNKHCQQGHVGRVDG